MADMMADAAEWLTDQLATNLSQTVSLTRASTTATTGVKATKSPILSQQDPQYLNFASCDWIVKASLYIIGGVVVEPQPNDLITESNGDVWQVLNPSETEDGHRPFDPFTNAWRIHTKRVTDG